MSSQALEQRCYRITGKVQGVFFRASTQRTARQLGLTGYARNLADGSVQVLAVGSGPMLEQLAAWLHHGPPSARVDRVELLQQGMADSVPKDFITG